MRALGMPSIKSSLNTTLENGVGASYLPLNFDREGNIPLNIDLDS